MSENKVDREAAQEWLVNYHGSIDATALRLAHEAGQRHVLAARTEVEWGVLYEADRNLVVYEPQKSEEAARALVAQSPTDTGLVQRTVSAWREVQ